MLILSKNVLFECDYVAALFCRTVPALSKPEELHELSWDRRRLAGSCVDVPQVEYHLADTKGETSGDAGVPRAALRLPGRKS